jgi:hypothetical protein
MAAERRALNGIPAEDGRLDLSGERTQAAFHAVAVPGGHHLIEDDLELRA